MRRMIAGIAAIALIAIACEKAPKAELEAAKKVVDEVKAAGAEKYAPKEFGKLTKMLSEAELKIARNRYREARELLEKVVKEAEKVKSLVEKKKEEEKKAPTPATPPAPAPVT